MEIRKIHKFVYNDQSHLGLSLPDKITDTYIASDLGGPQLPLTNFWLAQLASSLCTQKKIMSGAPKAKGEKVKLPPDAVVIKELLKSMVSCIPDLLQYCGFSLRKTLYRGKHIVSSHGTPLLWSVCCHGVHVNCLLALVQKVSM